MLFSINSKMKKSVNSQYKKIVNFTLPALSSKNGFKTCPMASKCAIGCYARSGAYRFSNVAIKHEANLQASLQSDFVTQVIAELNTIKPSLVRIHDSGDFYNEAYLLKWFAIAKNMPHIQFYAYTKMVLLVKKFNSLQPPNILFIFSYGGKQDAFINPLTDRHSFVFDSDAALRAHKYIDVSNDDTLALTNKKIGLVYHGNKNYTNTNWSKVTK